MDEVFALFLIIWFAITSVTSLAFWSTDYRNFNEVLKACQTTGYIQDTKNRIICAPEKPISHD